MIATGECRKAALVIVDVQVGVMADAWDAGRVIDHILHLVERARGQGVPVIWVQHSDNDLVRESPEWQWVPKLTPAIGELLIHKHFNSAFEKTTLGDELKKRGVRHIVLAGAATNWCIRATAYGALERGYDLTLVEDAHTTSSLEFDGGQIEAEIIIQELNIAMNWLNYPDRTNRTVTADKVEFQLIPEHRTG